MPTQHFYSLNKEKQEIIVNSGKKEFSSVNYEHASINKIIKDARISRGAFYYYFNGKDDLYLYLLENFITKFETDMNIDKNNDHIFTVITKLFEYFISNKNTDNCSFVSKIIENMKPGNQNFFISIFEKHINFYTNYSFIHILRYQEREDMKYLFNMLFGTFVISVSKLYLWNRTEEEARRKFNVSIDIIKHGALKEDDNV